MYNIIFLTTSTNRSGITIALIQRVFLFQTEIKQKETNELSTDKNSKRIYISI